MQAPPAALHPAASSASEERDSLQFEMVDKGETTPTTASKFEMVDVDDVLSASTGEQRVAFEE